MPLQRLFRGEKIRLTGLEPADIPTVTRWYQDSEFMRLMDTIPAYPRAESSLRRWLEDQSKSESGFLFGIRPLDRDELAGFVELDGIQWNHGVGWLGIGIGETAHQDKGYGREAMRLTLDFAFQELNLRRIQLTVFSYNQRAIYLYESLGFQREGVYREYLHRDGQYYDMLLYGILRREWEAHRSR